MGLRQLLDSLEREARLHLLGRILARSEVQRFLQSRLRVVDTVRRHPEVTRQPVEKPIFITGLGRSGTTFLHEILSQDPCSRVPMLWEAMYPVPPPETESYATDARIAAAEREIRVMDEIVPAFTAMHENAGDLPTECIFLFAHEFASDIFTGQYGIPSYGLWMWQTDHRPAYEAHRRLLQLLQWRHRPGGWVLKAPSHLSRLATLFDVYPDAQVVITHRDPLAVLGSLTNLMAALQWMRSDHVDPREVAAQMAFGFGHLITAVMRERGAGRLPEAQITDVLYPDLVRDPIGTVTSLYRRWGKTLSADAAARMRSYAENRPKNKFGAHAYTFADTGLAVEQERAKYAEYQRAYGVPSEISFESRP